MAELFGTVGFAAEHTFTQRPQSFLKFQIKTQSLKPSWKG